MARKTGSHAQTTGPAVRTAARRLFAQRGYASVSMREVAAEIGLQAGALYSYTPDKQSLLADLMLSHLDARAAAWAEIAPPQDDPTAWLEAFAAFRLGFGRLHLEAETLLRLERRSLTAENLTRLQDLETAERAALETVLAQGADAKLFAAPEPALAADAVLGLLEACAQSRLDLPAERLQRISWNMLRRAVGARGYQ